MAAGRDHVSLLTSGDIFEIVQLRNLVFIGFKFGVPVDITVGDGHVLVSSRLLFESDVLPVLRHWLILFAKVKNNMRLNLISLIYIDR